MNLSPLPIQKFFDNNGRPLVGGKLFTYAAGTSTKLATYSDEGGTSNPNPIILDFRGECSIWLDPTLAYKFVLAPRDDTDPPTNPIWSVDDIIAPIGTSTLTPDFIGQILWPQTAAEANTNLSLISYRYQPYYYNLLRAEIVPNDPLEAASNRAKLRTLWDPDEDGPTGWFFFPNTTGTDTYYFDGPIPIRPGVHIDGQGCTIAMVGTGTSADTNSGLFFALRDFTCVRCNFNIDWATGPASSSGYAIQIGARGTDSSYFTVFDNDLAVPMGNIRLQDIRITTTASGAQVSSTGAIQIIGGVGE